MLCSGGTPVGPIEMTDDWRILMNEAMKLEGEDTIQAFAKFRECINAAMVTTQSSLESNAAVGVAMESVYGALAA